MENIKEVLDKLEPVWYCADCLSIKVLTSTVDKQPVDYCGCCGCTEIKKAANIEEWKKLYFEKYGKEFYV